MRHSLGSRITKAPMTTTPVPMLDLHFLNTESSRQAVECRRHSLPRLPTFEAISDLRRSIPTPRYRHRAVRGLPLISISPDP